MTYWQHTCSTCWLKEMSKFVMMDVMIDVIKWKKIRVTGLMCGNSPVTGEFPSQRPVTRNFNIFFDLRPNKRLSKRSGRRWFETPSCWLWCRCNAISYLSHSPSLKSQMYELYCGSFVWAMNMYRGHLLKPSNFLFLCEHVNDLW